MDKGGYIPSSLSCSQVEATVLGLPTASTLGGHVPGTGSGMDCAKAWQRRAGFMGELPGFAAKVFGRYDVAWRQSAYLGGRDEHAWKTARTKIYPPRLSQCIAESHLEHAAQIVCEGWDEITNTCDGGAFLHT